MDLAGTIPYDTAFTEAQMEGKSIVEYGGEIAAPAVEKICREALDRLIDT